MKKKNEEEIEFIGDKRKQNTKKSTKKKKKSKIGKIIKRILLIILIAILIFVGWFVIRMSQNGGFNLKGFLATALGEDISKIENLERINILVMGESGVGDGYYLADTIMVASYNPQNQQASLMSIPRDTYVGTKDITSTSTTANYVASYKMNAAYRNRTNIPETVQLVSKMLDIDIDYYVIINTEALIQLVDAIGGVTFNVPIDMDYDDPTQDLHIHLKAGEQLLNGEQAEQLLRFRHNNDFTTYPQEYGDNDLGRMRTQREFIQETMKQVLTVDNIFNISKIVDIVYNNLTTDISIDNIKAYIPYLVEFNVEDLKTGVLPGTTAQSANGVYIYQYNKTETKKLVQELFKDDIDMTDEDVADLVNTTTTSETTEKTKGTIELLNGSGSTSKLKNAAEQLTKAGYDVVKTAKTSSTSKTAIINRTGKAETTTTELKETLGSLGKISTGEDNSDVDFTIIIGKDYTIIESE